MLSIINSYDLTIIAVSAGRAGTTTASIIEAHRGIINAQPAGRMLIVGGAGSLKDENGVRFVDGVGFSKDYKAEAQAFAQILDFYRASEGVDWTMLSPAFEIAPSERTGNYKVSLDTLTVTQLVLKALRLPYLTRQSDRSTQVTGLRSLTKPSTTS